MNLDNPLKGIKDIEKRTEVSKKLKKKKLFSVPKRYKTRAKVSPNPEEQLAVLGIPTTEQEIEETFVTCFEELTKIDDCIKQIYNSKIVINEKMINLKTLLKEKTNASKR
jgi:hypothetical protein